MMADLEEKRDSSIIGKKRKRVSKNKKKNWRKTDVDDVEEYLEDKRLEERTGGIIAEKPDEVLFFIDKKVTDDDDEVPKKRKKREIKPLKCHSILELDPKIKPARVAHNVITNHEKRVSKRIKELKAKNIVPKSQIIAAEQRKVAEEKRRTARKGRRQNKLADFDLWGETKEETKEDEHFMKVTKKKLARVPNTIVNREKSYTPAVEVTHPGASYNPTYEDHQDLLSKAHEVEVVKDKAEQRVYRSLDAKFPTAAEAPNEVSWLQEMGAGLFDDDDEDIVVEGPNNPPVRRDNKKTVQQRNKDKKNKVQMQTALKEKKKKITDAEFFRLKSLKKQIIEEQKKQEERKVRKEEKAEAMKAKTKTLGKMKFEDQDIEIKLSDELPGSLRRLKPEGDILTDRFKSLQKRNIIEPRKGAKRFRRYKLKTYEKKTHKEIVS